MPRFAYWLLLATGLSSLVLVTASLRGQAPSTSAGQLKNGIGMEFVRIASGEFMMGCSEGDGACADDEKPRHRVRITKGFEIGKYEVTQAQWMALMQDNPSSGNGNDRPVETVSKLDIEEFLAKLNGLNDGYRYRLPTEAEWEFVARAGQDAPPRNLDEVAWYAANADDETHPVGTKKPNAWGVFDILGNVREWVSDLYSPTYYGESPAADPPGPTLEQYSRNGFGNGPGFGPGGRGPGRGAQAPLAEPIALPADATPQQQIDALRREVAQLREEVRQLRNQAGGPPAGFGGGGRGGPQALGNGGPGSGVFQGGGAFPPGIGGLGRGGPQALGNPRAGPAVVGPGGQLIDPLDGLPTGLPVVRGGGWDQSAKFQRASARYTYYGPTLRVSDIGFRVVRLP